MFKRQTVCRAHAPRHLSVRSLCCSSPDPSSPWRSLRSGATFTSPRAIREPSPCRWVTVLSRWIVAFGTPLAWWLARHSFHGKWVLEAIILLALLTPPLAMGILLTTLFGPYGPVGSLVARTGVELTNSASAFVLAQFYGALPYYVVAARAAFEGVPRELEHISLTLGKSPWQTFWLVSMPLARLGLAAGIALAWVRALGEFGIVLILAYYPQGIPVKLWVNLQDIGLSAVYPLLWVFFLVAMPLPLILGMASRRQRLF